MRGSGLVGLVEMVAPVTEEIQSVKREGGVGGGFGRLERWREMSHSGGRRASILSAICMREVIVSCSWCWDGGWCWSGTGTGGGSGEVEEVVGEVGGCFWKKSMMGSVGWSGCGCGVDDGMGRTNW